MVTPNGNVQKSLRVKLCFNPNKHLNLVTQLTTQCTQANSPTAPQRQFHKCLDKNILPQTSIFSTKNKWKDKNTVHLHLSNPPVKTLSGPQSLRLETTTNYNIQSKGVREKVLGLETVSILQICITAKRVPTTAWTNVHKSTKKADWLSKKDVAKHID